MKILMFRSVNINYTIKLMIWVIVLISSWSDIFTQKNSNAVFQYFDTSYTTSLQDSLLLKLDQPNLLDKDKVKLYNKIGVSFQLDTAKAFYYFNKSIELGTKIDYKEGVSIAWSNMGSTMSHNGMSSKAIPYYQKSLDIEYELESKFGIYFEHNHIGQTYENIGDYSAALNEYQKGLSYFDPISDEKYNAKFNYSIAKMLGLLGDFDKSIAKMYTNIAQFKKLKDSVMLARSYDLLGTIWSELDIVDSSIHYASKAMELYEINNDRFYIARLKDAMAMDLVKANQHHKAITILQEAREVIKTDHMADLLGHNSLSLGYTYHCCSKQDSAAYYALLALDRYDEINMISNKLEAIKLLSDIYLAKNNYNKAYSYLSAAYELNDSIESAEKQQRALEAEAKFDSERKDKAIQLLNVSNDYQSRLLKWYLISGFSIAVLAFFLIKWLVSRNKQLVNEKLLASQSLQLKDQELLLKQNQIELKNRELTSYSLNSSEKQKFYSSILNKLELLKTSNKEISSNDIQKIQNELKHGELGEKEWDKFNKNFVSIHPEFWESFKKMGIRLTPNEKKLASYCKLNLSNKEIASISNISDISVRTSKYRLKLKLGLGADDDLYEFLDRI